MYDATMKGPEIIDMGMTVTLTGYSALFMRFAWAVQPRNYILFACHTFNVGAQMNQLRRAIEYKIQKVPGAEEEMKTLGQKVGGVCVGLGLLLASAGNSSNYQPAANLALLLFPSTYSHTFTNCLGRIRNVLSSESMPSFVKSMAEHPAGPMTIFFWAPTSKWLLSVNNLVDLKKGSSCLFISFLFSSSFLAPVQMKILYTEIISFCTDLNTHCHRYGSYVLRATMCTHKHWGNMDSLFLRN